MNATDPRLLLILAFVAICVFVVAEIVGLVCDYSNDKYVYFDDEDEA